MSKNPLAGQIETLIDKVVLPMEEAQVDFISTDAVAARVVDLIDPESVSPELLKFASLMHVKQLVRQRLAKRHDPVEIAEDYANGANDDLFGNSLQPYYPANRNGEKSYARKEVLSRIEIEANCRRMEKAGHSLLEHANALRAWFFSQPA